MQLVWLVNILLFLNIYSINNKVGDYLSSKAEDDHEKAERKREEWFFK